MLYVSDTNNNVCCCCCMFWVVVAARRFGIWAVQFPPKPAKRAVLSTMSRGGRAAPHKFILLLRRSCMYVCMYGIILCTYGTGAHINMWRSYCCATTISRPLSLLLFASSTVRTSIFPVLLLFLYRNPPRRANDVRPTRPSHPHRYVCMYA